MGDLNAVSPQDAGRYNETLLCGDGTYEPARQSGEYVENYCLQDARSGAWHLDFAPMATFLNTTDLVDLCFVDGGFYDVDTDRPQRHSQCGFSNPTLLIHMTGAYGWARGSHGHASAASAEKAQAGVQHRCHRERGVARGEGAEGVRMLVGAARTAAARHIKGAFR